MSGNKVKNISVYINDSKSEYNALIHSLYFPRCNAPLTNLVSKDYVIFNKFKLVTDFTTCPDPWKIAHKHNCKLWSDHHFYNIRLYLQIFANTGQKVITTTIVENAQPGKSSMVKWSNYDNAMHYNSTALERYIELCDSFGIDGPIHIASLNPCNNDKYIIYDENGNTTYIKAKVGDNTYCHLWLLFMKTFIPLARKKRWNKRVHFVLGNCIKKERKKCIKMLKKIIPMDFKPLNII